MTTPISETLKRQQIFAINVSLLIQKIFLDGYFCTLGEVYRPTEMARIYAKQGKGILESQHCDRLAIDINLFNHENSYLDKSIDHKKFGEYWESLHPENRWGGRFSDGNHYEMKG